MSSQWATRCVHRYSLGHWEDQFHQLYTVCQSWKQVSQRIFESGSRLGSKTRPSRLKWDHSLSSNGRGAQRSSWDSIPRAAAKAEHDVAWKPGRALQQHLVATLTGLPLPQSRKCSRASTDRPTGIKLSSRARTSLVVPLSRILSRLVVLTSPPISPPLSPSSIHPQKPSAERRRAEDHHTSTTLHNKVRVCPVPNTLIPHGSHRPMMFPHWAPSPSTEMHNAILP